LEEKIKYIVCDCGSIKSPCLDGFHFIFIKKICEVIRTDIMEAVNYFQNSGTIPKDVNTSFITLISKVKNHVELNDYKSILLVSIQSIIY